MNPPRSGRLVAVEGPSAVGKTTVTRRIAETSDWTLLGEASLRLRPRLGLRFGSPAELRRIEERLIAEERRRSETARQLTERGVDVLLDTAFFGPATYTAAVARLDPTYAPVAARIVGSVAQDVRTDRLRVPDRVVYLSASDRVLQARAAASRSVHPSRLAERHRMVGPIERGFWTAVASESRGAVRTLSALGSPASAASRLVRELARPAPPLPKRLVLRHLEELRRSAETPVAEIVKNRARSRRPPRR